MIEYLENRIKDSFDEVFFQTIDNQNITFGQFYTFAKTIANNWEDNGLKPGDRIGFRINNSLALLASYLACAIGGFTAVPISPNLKKENTDLIISQSKPAMILDKSPLLKYGNKLFKKDEIKIDTNPNSIFCIMFSSGTTGIPKGICLSLERTIGSALAFGKLSGFDQETRLYHVLPMYYMAGLMNAFLAPFLAGARIIEGPEFSLGRVKDFWERPVRLEVNAIVLFPIIASSLCRLARDKVLARKNASNIKLFQCTGNVLSKDLRRRFLDIFNKPLQDCYGITEVGGGLTMQTTEEALLDHNSGRMISELDYRLVNYLGRNKELWIRSPYMMIGYLENDNIKLPLDDNGYFNTGDFAEIIDDKLKITGRSKDIIIRGAENISPRSIENKINKIKGVEEVCVLGIPHKFMGEMVVAFILPCDSSKGSDLAKNIKDIILNKLPPEIIPDKIVVVDNFPRSVSGTIQKKLLLKNVLQ